ncbi:hypothetical protein D3C73_1134900 [compost metagenome]
MPAGHVVVQKGATAQHPGLCKPSIPHPQVRLGALVGTVQAALGEGDALFPVIQRKQQVKLRIPQREIFIRVQLYTGRTCPAEPLLNLCPCRPGCHPAGQRHRRVAVRVAGQETAGLRSRTGCFRRLAVIIAHDELIILPRKRRHLRCRDVQFIAGLQMVKAVCEGTQLIELAKSFRRNTEFLRHRGDGFTG